MGRLTATSSLFLLLATILCDGQELQPPAPTPDPNAPPSGGDAGGAPPAAQDDAVISMASVGAECKAETRPEMNKANPDWNVALSSGNVEKTKGAVKLYCEAGLNMAPKYFEFEIVPELQKLIGDDNYNLEQFKHATVRTLSMAMAGQEMCNCGWGSADEPPQASTLILSVIGLIKDGIQTEDTQASTHTTTTPNTTASGTAGQSAASTNNKTTLTETEFPFAVPDDTVNNTPKCEAHRTVTNADTITAGCAIGEDLAGTVVDQSMAIAATFAKGFDFDTVKSDSKKLIAAGLAGQALCKCDWKNSKWGSDYGAAMNLALGMQSTSTSIEQIPNPEAAGNAASPDQSNPPPSAEVQSADSSAEASAKDAMLETPQPAPEAQPQENSPPDLAPPPPPAHADTDPKETTF